MGQYSCPIFLFCFVILIKVLLTPPRENEFSRPAPRQVFKRLKMKKECS